MIDYDKEHQASILKGSFIGFCRFFYKHLTKRDFIISNPIGRESHHITIARELTKLSRLEIPSMRLNINIPPGHGKSLMVSMWVAWCEAIWPDCNFLYISYSHELATKNTAFIKHLMSCEMYKYLFDVQLKSDSRAKDSFQTLQGGSISAHGSDGTITGFDAGLPGQDRMTGAVIIDDAIKPNEAHSDTIRSKVIRNYEETIRQRVRGVNVPMVNIGQSLHEDDLNAYFRGDRDVVKWNSLILKALDDAGNALYPEAFPKDKLIALREKSPYVFASQMQQDPIPAGGALFKEDWFVLLDHEPDILFTFITADTAETEKTFNDATAFSFWGLYEVETFGRKTGQYALHWLHAQEIHVEPDELEEKFLDFWQECLIHKMPPMVAAIEKKSTGVTLVSTLKKLRGMEVRAIERNRSSGSKTQRFIDAQSFIASKLISLSKDARHTKMCIDHMVKITANDTHKRDDLADTCCDAIKIALNDKAFNSRLLATKSSDLAAKLMQNNNHIRRIKDSLYGGGQ